MVEQTQAHPFSRANLEIDSEQEAARIVQWLRDGVTNRLHRQGAVVGISGGIDSSVVLALCARAFGSAQVIGVLLPEKESSPESVILASRLADCYTIETVVEDITAALEGAGCYGRRDAAIQRIFPEYRPGWKASIALPDDLLERASLNVFSLIVIRPDGQELRKRLPLQEVRQIVAASNFKQRTRMSMLYYHAELRNYAVIGTPNKNERDLGFFVKYGDGGADLNPIGHMYKTQVFQLARYLDIPEAIQQRTPTTDTYPGGASQEQFFFRIPFDLLDTIWLGYENQVPQVEIAAAVGLSTGQVARVIADITTKKRTTEYLRTAVFGIEA